MKLLDPEHPMFKPLWTRVLTTVLPVVWAGVEFWQQEILWGFIFLSAGVYAGLTFWFHSKNQRRD